MSDNKNRSPRERAAAFADRLGIRMPLLLAPMSGACPPSLSIAVAEAGGMGGCGALLMKPDAIASWCRDFRQHSAGKFQLNLWIPDPPPTRNRELETRQREFLAQWGPPVPPEAGDPNLPDFDAQCQALLAAKPAAISSIMGLYPPAFVAEMKARRILWFANATTVAEARAAEAAGADAIIAQGMEAGGHRGAFDASAAERAMVGLVALVPQVADAVSVPVIATGGIADARAIAAALILGASAAQIGTAFLRSKESSIPPAYADQLGRTEADETMVTRSFSGRPGRCVANSYARAATAVLPAAYPIQRGLTFAMREAAIKSGAADRMQMWAGQSAKLARAEPATTIARDLWAGASLLLP